MELCKPFMISARLMPALKISDCTISLEISHYNGDGRACYDVRFDFDNGESINVDDLRSGCGRGSIQDGFESLLSFLGAAAEAYRYEMGGRKSENADLFAAPIMEWAYQNSDEISMAEMEIGENADLIIE